MFQAPHPTPKATLEPLVIGTRIHCVLNGGQDGIIFQIHGEQRPDTVGTMGGGAVVHGGNAEFDVVFIGHGARISNRLPEALLRTSSQWSVLNGVATADEIKTALAAAETRQLQLQAAAQDREARAAKLDEHFGNAGATVKLPAGMMAITLSLKYDNSDSMTDYFDRHASLSRDYALLVVKKQAQTERLARKALALVHELGILQWKWKTETYSMGHGNYLESSGFELPADLQGIKTHYRGGDVTHAHWEIEFSVAYGKDTELPAHKNFGESSGPATGQRQSAGSVTLVETTHTKKGHAIFVVQLADRVERAEYERINRMCRDLDGYYSSFRGHGAVPGFTFKERSNAEAFMSKLTGTPPVAPAPVEPVSLPPATMTLPPPVPQAAPTPQIAPMPGFAPLGMAQIAKSANCEISQTEPSSLTAPASVPAWRKRLGLRPQ